MIQQPMRVIVVGAGLAGLAIAHGLKKNNIPYVIVDRETAPRDRNWAITLGWALPLLQKLLPDNLYDSIQQCQPDPNLDAKLAGQTGLLVRDGATGEAKTVSRFPSIRRLNIQKTKRHFSEGLDIRYGKRLVDIALAPGNDAGVTAYFDDGTSETGTTIVGADGGASHVRRWLLGDLALPEALPCDFMNFSFTLPADIALRLDKEMNPTVDVGAHPSNMYLGVFLLDKPDIERPETWVFYILSTWSLSDAGIHHPGSRLSELRSRMRDWFDLFKVVVDNVPDDVEIKPDQLRIWKTRPWDNHRGRITLAGDAAHSMTFHRGQGGNLAIKDADELVKNIITVQRDKVPLQDAIDTYDKGALLRGEEVEISRQCSMAFLDYDNFENSPVFKMGVNPAVKF
ncbi:putative monooxygenase [Talaromyces proteolyticus]|uniref:Monooxygenase n=1 Tax=Talaromyces proteolyticus TaxID=1131652 RepID=A0AAD4KL33_9EURO|nr:putative monooxygenase [Talaromyces proteolyticus]KAH8691651.1 putative monooxygenase [Talaromyces proteolyticus]